MIIPSETARRTTTLAQTIGATDGKTGERYALYERAKKERPTCKISGCRVSSSKVVEKSPRCDACEDFKLSKTDQKHVGGGADVKLPGLKAARERAGLTKRQVWDRTGVLTATQSRIEGGGTARNWTARKLAAALGVDVRELEKGRGESD